MANISLNIQELHQLTDLDPALVSRSNIVNFKPTTKEQNRFPKYGKRASVRH